MALFPLLSCARLRRELNIGGHSANNRRDLPAVRVTGQPDARLNLVATPALNPAANRLILAGRLLALAGALVALALFLLFMDNFNPTGQIIFAAWAGVPIPLGWWIGRKLARGTAALAVLVAGLALLWTLGAWLYWDAFLGPSSRSESLAGLIVLFAPVYQWVGIAVTLLLAWLVGRAARPATKPE